MSRGILIGVAVITLAVVYVVGLASWQASNDRLLRFSDLLVQRSLDVFMASWIFYMSSSIGSFLNVVAWRMPRGVSINGRSHCPRCNSLLGWAENWPVFGWLLLGGRCRTCRLPISPRYPIVEFAVGMSILVVAWQEFYAGGANLPYRAQMVSRVGSLWTPYVTTESLSITIYHAVAIAFCWALGLVRFDGHRLPRSLVTLAIGALSIAMIAYPVLMIVPWEVDTPEKWNPAGRYLDAAMRVITGLAAAVIIGRSLARYVCPTADPKMNPLGKGTGRMMDLIAMLAIPGIVVGWQAVFAVTIIAVLLAYGLPILFATRIDSLARLSISLPIAFTVQLYGWNFLHGKAFWPSVGTEPLVTLAWAAAVLIVPAGLKAKTLADSPRPEVIDSGEAKSNTVELDSVDAADESSIGEASDSTTSSPESHS